MLFSFLGILDLRGENHSLPLSAEVYLVHIYAQAISEGQMEVHILLKHPDRTHGQKELLEGQILIRSVVVAGLGWGWEALEIEAYMQGQGQRAKAVASEAVFLGLPCLLRHHYAE